MTIVTLVGTIGAVAGAVDFAGILAQLTLLLTSHRAAVAIRAIDLAVFALIFDAAAVGTLAVTVFDNIAFQTVNDRAGIALGADISTIVAIGAIDHIVLKALDLAAVLTIGAGDLAAVALTAVNITAVAALNTALHRAVLAALTALHATASAARSSTVDATIGTALGAVDAHASFAGVAGDDMIALALTADGVACVSMCMHGDVTVQFGLLLTQRPETITQILGVGINLVTELIGNALSCCNRNLQHTEDQRKCRHQ